MSSYKESTPFDKRILESNKIKQKYPTRIPIICERITAKKSDAKTQISNIDKNKFLVPGDLTMGQFLYVIRKRIQLSPEQALFIYVNNSILPATSSSVSTIYEEFKDDDGFLYIIYSGENTFG